MRRRQFISLLGGAAVACPLAARAQQQTAKNPRIGFLYGGVSEGLALRVNQFLEGVRGIERNRIELVSRVAEGNPARLPALAIEIVAQKVDVLFAARDVKFADRIIEIDEAHRDHWKGYDR